MSQITPTGRYFKCCLCRFTSASSSDFLQHYTTKHKVSVNVGCWCVDCGYIFNTCSYYVAHIISCTGNKFIWHRCGVPGCHFGSLDILFLLTHMCKKHVKTKPKCQKCFESFSSFFNWIHHIQNVCPVYQSTSSQIDNNLSVESTDNHTTKQDENISNLQINNNPLTPKVIPEITIVEESEQDSNLAPTMCNQSPDLLTSELNTMHVNGSTSLCLPMDISSEKSKDISVDTSIKTFCGFETWDDWWQKWLSMKHTEPIQDLKSKAHFFRCMNIGCTFATHYAEDFTEHLSKEHRSIPQSCSFCLKTCFNPEALIAHAGLHESQLFQCPLCIYRASTPAHVLLHQQDFHKVSPLQKVWRCPGPLPAYSGQTDLMVYEYIKPFRCTECLFETRNVEQYGLHQCTHPSQKCFVCDLATSSFNQLLEHLQIHGIHDFHCYYCPFGSASPDNVFEHICINHPEKPLKQAYRSDIDTNPNRNLLIMKPFMIDSTSIDKIGPGITNELGLPISTRMVISTPEKPISSVPNTDQGVLTTMSSLTPKNPTSLISNNDFQSSTILTTMTSCTNEEPASLVPNQITKCTLCDASKKSIKDLKNHLIIYHNLLEIFKCKHCKKSFESLDTLETHTEVGHDSQQKISYEIVKMDSLEMNSDDVSSLTKPFNFLCVFCGFQNTNKGDMIDHLSEEIEYLRCTCEICLFEEFSKKKLQEHIADIHGVSCLILMKIDSFDVRETWIQRYLHSQAAASCGLSKCLFPSKVVQRINKNSCPMCEKVIVGKSHLTKHLFEHLRYKPYNCVTCFLSFDVQKDVIEHSRLQHEDANDKFVYFPSEKIDDFTNNLVYGEDKLNWPVFFCQYCNFKHYFLYEVFKHSNSRHPDLTLPLLKVNKKRSKSRSCVSSDVDTEASGSLETMHENIPVKCMVENCMFKTCDLIEYQNHWKSKHKKRRKILENPIEEQVNNSDFTKEVHNRKFNSNCKTLKRGFFCVICKSGPFSMTKLNLHLKRKHPSTSRSKKKNSDGFDSNNLATTISAGEMDEYTSSDPQTSSNIICPSYAEDCLNLEREESSTNDSFVDNNSTGSDQTNNSKVDSASSSNEKTTEMEDPKYASRYGIKPEPVDLENTYLRLFDSRNGPPLRIALKYYKPVYYRKLPGIKLQDCIKHIKLI